MDDSGFGWRKSLEELRKFHEDLNQLDENLKFTLEVETSGQLNYLDAKITRTRGGFEFELFTKECSSEQVMNYNSYHDPSSKNSIIKGETHRILNITDKKDRDLGLLKEKFLKNGYPSKVIDQNITAAKNKHQNKRSKQTEKTWDGKKYLTTKFVGKVGKKMKKITKKFGIKTIFKKRLNLENIFSSSYKYDTKKRKGLIYKIDCSCGDFYIGETGKAIEDRVKQHKRSVLLNDKSNALACHKENCDKEILWNKPEALNYQNIWNKRKIGEAICIQKLQPKINLNGGFQIRGNWR